jgi:glycosyltransferase involved in cell wall biosynthesis
MNLPFQQNLSIVLLNYNRFSLLRTTLLSLLQTVPHVREIFVVDNASQDFSCQWLDFMAARYPQIRYLPQETNRGGLSINVALEQTSGEYILIAENDHQYLPGWDSYFASVMDAFPEVAQLSPLGPIPQQQIGEIWTEKAHHTEVRNGITIHRAIHTLTTCCLIRRCVIEKGIRFHNLEDKEMPLPADERFSREIQEQGWWAAWSEPYQVINWGHHSVSQQELPDYYRKNWQRKIELGIDGLEQMDARTGSSIDKMMDEVQKSYQLHEERQKSKDRIAYLEEKLRQTEAHSLQLQQAHEGLIFEYQKLKQLVPSNKKPWYKFW